LKERELFCRLSSVMNRRAGKHKETKFKSKIAHATSVSVKQILVFKKFALRNGIWFRALNLVERGILDLTTQYVACIKSSKLATVVTAILEKLRIASEGVVDRLVRTVGFSLAKKVSIVAQSWGNRLAVAWAQDADFARYLAVTHLNTSGSH
jgi:hypothetical protein